MAKNYELLDFVFGKIKRRPGQWYQGVWASRFGTAERKHMEKLQGRHICETAFCFAGHTAIVARPDIEWVTRNKWRHATGVAFRARDPKTGRSTDMRDEATQALGLTINEADQLFAGNNTLIDIERIINRWKDVDRVPR